MSDPRDKTSSERPSGDELELWCTRLHVATYRTGTGRQELRCPRCDRLLEALIKVKCCSYRRYDAHGGALPASPSRLQRFAFGGQTWYIDEVSVENPDPPPSERVVRFRSQRDKPAAPLSVRAGQVITVLLNPRGPDDHAFAIINHSNGERYGEVPNAARGERAN